jgi:hypothetical protein
MSAMGASIMDGFRNKCGAVLGLSTVKILFPLLNLSWKSLHMSTWLLMGLKNLQDNRECKLWTHNYFITAENKSDWSKQRVQTTYRSLSLPHPVGFFLLLLSMIKYSSYKRALKISVEQRRNTVKKTLVGLFQIYINPVQFLDIVEGWPVCSRLALIQITCPCSVMKVLAWNFGSVGRWLRESRQQLGPLTTFLDELCSFLYYFRVVPP